LLALSLRNAEKTAHQREIPLQIFMTDFSASFMPLLDKICHFPATNFSRPCNRPVLSYLAEHSAIWQQCKLPNELVLILDYM
jgi:hypothetical protein